MGICLWMFRNWLCVKDTGAAYHSDCRKDIKSLHELCVQVSLEWKQKYSLWLDLKIYSAENKTQLRVRLSNFLLGGGGIGSIIFWALGFSKQSVICRLLSSPCAYEAYRIRNCVSFQSSSYVSSYDSSYGHWFMFFWDDGCFSWITIESESFLHMGTVSLSVLYFWIIRKSQEPPCFIWGNGMIKATGFLKVKSNS